MINDFFKPRTRVKAAAADVKLTKEECATMTVPAAKVERFQNEILGFYERHRRDLPWRKTTDKYAVFVSEVMLQQTQVSRVVTKYGEWMKAFPTVRDLAAAPLERVLGIWSGLGYNSRGKRLWEAAKLIVEASERNLTIRELAKEKDAERKAQKRASEAQKSSGSAKKVKTEGTISERAIKDEPRDTSTADVIIKTEVGEEPSHGNPPVAAMCKVEPRHEVPFPSTEEELLALPGIGPYTARAVLIFAENKDIATIDTNIRRILIHHFGIPETTTEAELFKFAEQLVPTGRSRDYHNGLMDYGATFLTSKKSGIKPVSVQSKFKGSKRYYRGAVMKAILATPEKYFSFLSFFLSFSLIMVCCRCWW